MIICFVRYNDEILLLKRSDKVWTYKGKWNVVAGYLDEIKPLREKALEELREKPKIKLDFEHTEARWVKKEDLSKYDAVPNLMEGAKRVLK